MPKIDTYSLDASLTDNDSLLGINAADGKTKRYAMSAIKTYVESVADISAVTAGTGLTGGGESGAVTLTVGAAQTTITSIFATDVKIGEDDETKIDFETADTINFYAGNEKQLILTNGALTPGSNAIIDLGTDALEFKDAYFDGTVEADAITVGGTNITAIYSPIAGSSSVTTVGTISSGTWQSGLIGIDYGGTGLSGETDGYIVIADGSGSATHLDVGSSTGITILGTIATGVWQGTAIASGYIAADAITGAKIADDAIDSEHYTDGSIDTAHLAADAVTGAKIADNAIDSEHYTDGSIDNAHIADDAIDSEHYTDGSIDNAHIADDAIDSEHYVDGSIDTAHLGDLQVTTAKIAADAITSAKLADNAVDSEHYTDGSIDNAHIADDAIDSEHYADGSIDNAHIADDAIDSEHYADGSIDNAHIADNAIDSEHYADGSIDTAHYAAGSVDATALGADAVTAAKIGDNIIDSEHYAAGSIDLEHMSSESVDEDNLYISNSGSNGNFLQKQSGNSGGLTWAAVSVSTDSVDSDAYVDGSIDTVHLSADCVDGTKIADDAIDSEHYTDGSIDAAHLATGAVTDLGTITQDTVTFTSANSTDPLIIIKNTTSDTAAARLHFVKDKGAAGADGDDIGTIDFISDDAAQTQTSFAKIVAEVSESADTDEAGKLSFYVAESDGTTTALAAGLVLEGEHATNGEVDVTIGAGTASTTTIAGTLTMGSTATLTNAGLVAVANQSGITGLGTITSGVWTGTAIASGYIAADAITGAKIADDAIDSEHYTDGSIYNAHIADDAIDSEHYADGSIDNAHIADDAIDSEHYATGSIDTAHIADNQVTHDKLEGRYTALSALGTGTDQTLDFSAYTTFTATMNGDADFTITNPKQGQVVDLILNGNYAATLVLSGGTFNKIGSTDYDGSATNLIQILCADDSGSEIFYYSVAPYTSDTTP